MNFFFQKYFGILKIGQKKCPKMKIGKESWEFLHPHCIKIFSVTLFFEKKSICYDNFKNLKNPKKNEKIWNFFIIQNG